MTTLTTESKNGREDKILNMHYFFFSIGSEREIRGQRLGQRNMGRFYHLSFGLKDTRSLMAPMVVN